MLRGAGARVTLLELGDGDIDAMLAGAAFVRPGLAQPPGGVDEPDVLAHVRRLASDVRRAGYPGGHWMMVADDEVVGLCGIKAPPSSDGEVEIGYGVAASRRRRGYASAALGAAVDVIRRDPRLTSIVALTVPENLASQRVLARNGFARAGTQIDPADGEVYVWRLPVTQSVRVERA